MRYATITRKDYTTKCYMMQELKITKGFVKIIHNMYGNVAIPMNDVVSISIQVLED